MFFDAVRAPSLGDGLIEYGTPSHWRVDSEYGLLTDVLLAPPDHLEMLPANAVTRTSLAAGHECCIDTATSQHRGLVRLLEREGVNCHFVTARPGLPDLAFMRDAAVMTPWGLIQLKPGAPHRRPEAACVAAAAAALGVPIAGRIGSGTIEGGDICLLRPGVVIIGYSGERTDKAGAWGLAALFEAQGWEVIYHCFDPHHLHLDTHFTLVDRDEAVACPELLNAALLDRLAALGVAIIPATREEVGRLGANLLCLGDRRIVSSTDNIRINQSLSERGYEVFEAELDQFSRCGGGVHCLTLPLGRAAG